MKSKYLTKLLIAVQIVTLSLLGVGNTYAIASSVGFSDSENSTGNVLGTTTLDLGMRSGQGNFVSGADIMERGASVARDIYVQNLGDLPFAYRSSYEYKSGDAVLCNALELKVWYNWYDTSSTRHMELKYSGPLKDFSDFDTNSPPLHDPELVLPNSHPFVSNSFYSEDEHWFYYQITIPEDAPYDASQKTCTFDIKTTAWQEDFVDETNGFWDEETIESTIGTADWAPYVKIEDPEHEDVVFGTVDIYGTVTDDNPDHYWLVIQDSSGTTVAGPGTVNESSSFIDQKLFEWDTTGVPNGTYTIKLEARDAAGNKNPDLAPVPSDPEDPNDSVDWIDVEVENGDSASEGDVVINEIMWGGSSEHELDEWVELRNMTDHKIDLNGWEIEGAGPSDHSITLSGTIGTGDGKYYLVSHYATDHIKGSSEKAAINDSIDEDLVDKSMHLHDNGEQLVLKDSLGNEIDKTPEASSGWADGEAGSHGHGTPWRSMERDDTPGDGTDADNWHTCTDAVCNDDTYWDIDDGDDYGTPRLENHSEGDEDEDDDGEEEKDSSTGLEQEKAEDEGEEDEDIPVDLEQEDEESSDEGGDEEDGDEDEEEEESEEEDKEEESEETTDE